jgi:hypothetical protein
MKADIAKVICIGERYFCRYKNKRIQTAWHIAGAKLFMPESPDLEKYTQLLESKKKDFIVYNVEVLPF